MYDVRLNVIESDIASQVNQEVNMDRDDGGKTWRHA